MLERQHCRLSTVGNLQPGQNGLYARLLDDVHGARAQRSDPKTSESSAWPTGHGPQGDAIRIDNFVRLVRDADAGDEGAVSPEAMDYAYLPAVIAMQ